MGRIKRPPQRCVLDSIRTPDLSNRTPDLSGSDYEIESDNSERSASVKQTVRKYHNRSSSMEKGDEKEMKISSSDISGQRLLSCGSVVSSDLSYQDSNTISSSSSSSDFEIIDFVDDGRGEGSRKERTRIKKQKEDNRNPSNVKTSLIGSVETPLVVWSNVWFNTEDKDIISECIASGMTKFRIRSFEKIGKSTIQCSLSNRVDDQHIHHHCGINQLDDVTISRPILIEFNPRRLKPPGLPFELMSSVIGPLFERQILMGYLTFSQLKSMRKNLNKRSDEKNERDDGRKVRSCVGLDVDNSEMIDEMENKIDGNSLRIRCERMVLGFTKHVTAILNNNYSEDDNQHVMNEKKDLSVSSGLSEFDNRKTKLVYRSRHLLKQLWEWILPDILTSPIPRKSEKAFHIDPNYFFQLIRLISQRTTMAKLNGDLISLKFSSLSSNDVTLNGTLSSNEHLCWNLFDERRHSQLKNDTTSHQTTDRESINTNFHHHCLSSSSSHELDLAKHLKCRLTPYQLRAVKFALWREGDGSSTDSHRTPGLANDKSEMSDLVSQSTEVNFSKVPSAGVPFSFHTELPGSPFRPNIWIHHSFSKMSLEPVAPSMYSVKGGLLCDEMGLGKTVEVMGLLILRPATPQFLKYSISEYTDEVKRRNQANDDDDLRAKGEKKKSVEEIGCFCGISSWDVDAKWVACDVCDEWFHSSCVGTSQIRFGTPDSPKIKPNVEFPKLRPKLMNRGASKNCQIEMKLKTDLDESIGTNEETFNSGAKLEEPKSDQNRKMRKDRDEEMGEETSEDPFICPVCFARSFPPIPIKGTLVVVPGSILSQWKLEIE